MKNKKLIIFIDCGDTIIDEATEIRDETGTVKSFENSLTQNDLYDYFSAHIYSEKVGVYKPDAKMFEAALNALNLTKKDCNRIVMVGNNLSRDIKGANNMGITSIFLCWTPRYPKKPADQSEIPDYIINEPLDLIELVEQLNSELTQNKNVN